MISDIEKRLFKEIEKLDPRILCLDNVPRLSIREGHKKVDLGYGIRCLFAKRQGEKIHDISWIEVFYSDELFVGVPISEVAQILYGHMLIGEEKSKCESVGAISSN